MYFSLSNVVQKIEKKKYKMCCDRHQMSKDGHVSTSWHEKRKKKLQNISQETHQLAETENHKKEKMNHSGDCRCNEVYMHVFEGVCFNFGFINFHT